MRISRRASSASRHPAPCSRRLRSTRSRPRRRRSRRGSLGTASRSARRTTCSKSRRRRGRSTPHCSRRCRRPWSLRSTLGSTAIQATGRRRARLTCRMRFGWLKRSTARSRIGCRPACGRAAPRRTARKARAARVRQQTLRRSERLGQRGAFALREQPREVDAKNGSPVDRDDFSAFSSPFVTATLSESLAPQASIGVHDEARASGVQAAVARVR